MIDYRNRLRKNLSNSLTHFVRSSTSLECPPRKAKSSGVAPSSLGKAKAWIPPGRHRRNWESLVRPHLTARCSSDSLWRETEKRNMILVPLFKKSVIYFHQRDCWSERSNRTSELDGIIKSIYTIQLILQMWRRQVIWARSGAGASLAHHWYNVDPPTVVQVHPLFTQIR